MNSSDPRAASARRAVEALLRPRSVVLVGASSDVEKFSGQPLRNLLAAGFTGAVYPVNPRGGEMNGVPVLSDAADVPYGTDLGVIMVPAAAAVDVVAILGDRGVTTAIVAVGGFAELGTEAARELQDRLGETARRHGIRIVGPNTNGVYNATDRIPLGYNYAHSLRLRPGAIGLISHSGAMLGGFLSLLEQFGQGISAFVSCGNEVDLTMDDYCDYLVDDNATHVLALIMDAVSDGARFRRLAERARAVGKPIVVLKLGNSSAGTQATQAHSSRLAGSSAAYEAVFHAEGIVSVPTLETLALAVTLLAQRRGPRRAGVVATSSSGAGSIMVADVLTELGTPPVALAPATVEAMTPHAGFAQVINPFDNGAAGLANTEPSLLALADDPRAGSFVSYLHPMPTGTWRTALASATADVARRHLDMPVVAISPASMADDEARIYREAGVPVLGSTLDALTVIAALHRRLAAAAHAEVVETDQTRTTTAEGHSLSEIDSKQVLRPFGIRFPIEILASTADDATTAATSLGLPVVLKATGANLTHKTEHALVEVGVGSAHAVRTVFRRLDEVGRALDPDGYRGVLVCEQIPAGVELVLGVTVDPDFGPMVLVGAGGILAELIADTALAAAPITPDQAEALLHRLKVDRLLDGYRGTEPADRDAAIDQIVALSRAAVELSDSISAIDLNPVRVLAKGRGAVALDALVINSSTASSQAT